MNNSVSFMVRKLKFLVKVVILGTCPENFSSLTAKLRELRNFGNFSIKREKFPKVNILQTVGLSELKFGTYLKNH